MTELATKSSIDWKFQKSKRGPKSMKKLMIAVAVLGLLLVSSYAMADQSADATAHVYVNIDPNIAVTAIDANVQAASLQTGDVSVPITFQVDANTEAVELSAIVTNLYKGDDPSGTEVKPILPSGLGVIIDPANANPINGGSNLAAYSTVGTIVTDKGTFVGLTTQSITFESSQDGHFSQAVEVTPSWGNSDNEKPQGQYSGYVELLAAVVGGIK